MRQNLRQKGGDQMNERTQMATAKRVAQIASWAMGEPVSASIDYRCYAFNSKYTHGIKPSATYFLWIGTPKSKGENASFYGSWREVLGLVEWLQDVTVPVSYRDR